MLVALELDYRVYYVFKYFRTGQRTLLVYMADEYYRRAARLAKRSNADAHSRTWATLPGELSTLSVLIVCMESMTMISGDVFFTCAKMLSSDVSHSIMQLSVGAWAILSARIFS